MHLAVISAFRILVRAVDFDDVALLQHVKPGLFVKHSTLKHVTDCACDVTVALWACPSQRLMLKPAACWQSQHCQACLLEDMAYKLCTPKHQGC